MPISEIVNYAPISFTIKCDMPKIVKVLFNAPATVVFWDDCTKTVVKCGKDDEYSKEKGLAMCISKKALGNKGNYNEVFKKWLAAEKTKENEIERR